MQLRRFRVKELTLQTYIQRITEFGLETVARQYMVNDVDLLRQRELNFAIVDEVDSNSDQ